MKEVSPLHTEHAEEHHVGMSKVAVELDHSLQQLPLPGCQELRLPDEGDLQEQVPCPVLHTALLADGGLHLENDMSVSLVRT